MNPRFGGYWIALAFVTEVLLAGFFFTASTANAWAAWAPPGENNPGYENLARNQIIFGIAALGLLMGAIWVVACPFFCCSGRKPRARSRWSALPGREHTSRALTSYPH